MAGCGGAGVWLPRLPGGICMCVWRPQTSCSFYAAGTRGPGRAGWRRASRDAGTSSPGRHQRLPGRPAPPSAPVAASPSRPRGASCSRVGARPSGLRGHLRPLHRAWPRAPWRPHRPGSPAGRSHERDVQLSPHRGHRLPVRRGLRQWLHQHFGVSEPGSGGGAGAGRGRRGPWCHLRASCRRPPIENLEVPNFKERGNGSPPFFRERKFSVCPGRSRGPCGSW